MSRDLNEIVPLDLKRLAERLEFHEYDVKDIGSELRCTWEGVPFVLRVTGVEEELRLILGASGEERFSDANYLNLIAACNVVNTENFLTAAFPISTAKGWAFYAQVVIDAGAGLSDQQLDDHLGVAISSILSALKRATELLS